MLLLTPSQDPHNKAREPKDRRKKRKSLRRTPLPTIIISKIDITPRPRTATLQAIIRVVLQQTEYSEPSAAEDDIGADVGQGRAGSDCPEKGEADGSGGNNDAVYEAVEGADAVFVVLVQEVGGQAKDDGGCNKLCEAQ